MATVVEESIFDKYLKLAKISPYDISLDGARLYMESQTNFINTLNIHILNEYNMFDFGGDVVGAFNEKNAFKAFHRILGAVSKLLRRAIEIVFGVTKKFLAMSVDVALDNKEFLKKYGTRLLSVRGNPRIYLERSHNMDIARLKDVGIIANNNFDATYSVYINLLKLGQVPNEESAEEYEYDLADHIYDQRTKVIYALTGDEPGNVSDENYPDLLNNALFGDEEPGYFNLKYAIGIVKSYDDIIAFIKKLSVEVSSSLAKRLKAIDEIRKKTNTPENVKPIFIKQCKLLSGYTNQSINDIIATLNIMMEYANNANRQAKAVCIKALQQ